MTPLLAQRPRTDRAFERVYRRHVGDVYRYALAVLRNPADAEDVTQTTFLNAYRAFQRGERPDAAHNWLIAIAHNVCRQRFRQSARRPQEVAFDDDVADRIEDDDAPTAEDIRRALGHLAFNQRAALVMRELEGRSYQEIADILDVSVSAVETLIFRARRALREQLEGSLTCGEAELAISKQLDGRLARAERGQLRAHLRECAECATFARRQRAQRAALKSIAAVPLPSSLASFFGGGGATVAGGVAAKVAAVAAAGAVAAGGGYEVAQQVGSAGSQRPQSPGAVPNARTPLPRATPVIAEAGETELPPAAAPNAGRALGHAEKRAGAPGQAKADHPLRPEHPAQARGPKKAVPADQARAEPRGHSVRKHVAKKPRRRGHARQRPRPTPPPLPAEDSEQPPPSDADHGRPSPPNPKQQQKRQVTLLPMLTLGDVQLPKPPGE